MNIDEQIYAFAKSKRIKPEDFPAFRDNILNQLRKNKGVVYLGVRLKVIKIERKEFEEIISEVDTDGTGTKKD